MSRVLTANDLRSGEPVFADEAGRWSPRFAAARRFEAGDDAAEAALERARAAPTVVVDPYLVELAGEGPLAAPVSYRERIRALGPPAHPDMGKQAEGGATVAALRAASGGGRSSGRTALIARKR